MFEVETLGTSLGSIQGYITTQQASNKRPRHHCERARLYCSSLLGNQSTSSCDVRNKSLSVEMVPCPFGFPIARSSWSSGREV